MQGFVKVYDAELTRKVGDTKDMMATLRDRLPARARPIIGEAISSLEKGLDVASLVKEEGDSPRHRLSAAETHLSESSEHVLTAVKSSMSNPDFKVSLADDATDIMNRINLQIRSMIAGFVADQAQRQMQRKKGEK